MSTNYTGNDINIFNCISCMQYVQCFILVSCEALSLTSGEISYNRSPVSGRYPAETVASFSCNDGYSQFGPSSRNCRTSGAWNLQNTTCESNKINIFKFLHFYSILFKLWWHMPVLSQKAHIWSMNEPNPDVLTYSIM